MLTRSPGEESRISTAPSRDSPSQTPAAAVAAVTHVLCCPSCAFMSLQAQLLASHAQLRHGLSSVTVYRCRLCSAATTQSDIMREHATIYHGLSGDCNTFTQLSTAELIRPDSEHTISTGKAAPIGSKKRKSTVPERVSSHADFVEPAVASSKQRKPSRGVSFGEGDGVTNPQHPVLHQSSVAQILLPCGILSGLGSVIGNGADVALDLSMKAVPSISPASHRQGDQQQQQQQQRQNFNSSQNARLLQWFQLHRTRPYPSTEDTKSLSVVTGLNYSQVKKWFANKRMRSKAGTAASTVAGDDGGDFDDEPAQRSWTDDTIGSGPVALGNDQSSQTGSSPPSTDFDRSDELRLVVRATPSP